MIDEKVRETERAVVGAVLLHPACLDDVLAETSPEQLFDPRLELVLAAAVRVQSESRPVDVLTVADELGDDLTRAGGLSHLHELLAAACMASNAGYLAAEVIRPAAVSRALANVGHRLTGEGDPFELIDQARTDLDALATGRTRPTSVADDVLAAIDALEGEGGIPTPWRDLTEAVGGWRHGSLYYVGARPGVGKTAVALEVALDVARRGQSVFIASLEMSKTELYHRLLSNVGSVDNKRMTHRRLTREDWDRLARASKHIGDLPLHVNDDGNQRVSDIRAQARAIQREHGLGLVVIDYLQLMRSAGRVDSRQQEVAGFSRALKLMAKELNVPVLALSQLNRGPESRHDRRPSVSDLKESGALEQDGDVVVLLHRDPDDDPTAIELLIGKNRHGPDGLAIRLDWDGAHSRVSDVLPGAVPHSYYQTD